MISPANMKNGTASSGKLSAPLTTFCARICASNRSRCHISATPLMSSANAMGMPMPMAISKEPRKMVTVMMRSVLWGAVCVRGAQRRSPWGACGPVFSRAAVSSLSRTMTSSWSAKGTHRVRNRSRNKIAMPEPPISTPLA